MTKNSNPANPGSFLFIYLFYIFYGGKGGAGRRWAGQGSAECSARGEVSVAVGAIILVSDTPYSIRLFSYGLPKKRLRNLSK